MLFRSDGTAGTNAFFWSFSAGVTPEYSTQANPQVTFSQAGTYHVTLYVENSAGSGFYSLPITVEGCAGLQENENDFRIYPNPAATLLNIESSNEFSIESVTLIDAMGRVVLNEPIRNAKTAIDISDFPNGMYVVRLFSSRGNFNKSLLIQK